VELTPFVELELVPSGVPESAVSAEPEVDAELVAPPAELDAEVAVPPSEPLPHAAMSKHPNEKYPERLVFFIGVLTGCSGVGAGAFRS
jgi:hypothetical protein